MTTPRLQMRGVRKAFGPTVALGGVDLSVAPGEVHALVGENGAGKSTLMKVLSGAIAADVGAMALDGAPYAPAGPADARGRGVAMVYQELSLAPHMTVAENILLGREPTRRGLLDRRRARAVAAEALARLDHRDIDPDARVAGLSTAARQIVEIARALASDCRVLVLDEPTSSLGRADAAQLFERIRALAARGIAVIYISHFLEEVLAVADRYTVLRDGVTAGRGAIAGTRAEDLVALMVGRAVEDLFPRGARAPGEVLLELDALAGEGLPADASLQLRRGEVLGVAGLVGAGRTELLRAIFGLAPIRSGAIRVGAHIGWASPARRWAQGVGLLSEDRKGEGLALSMSVADNLLLAPGQGAGPLGWAGPAARGASAARWIEALGVRCAGPAQRIRGLSGGNQQKVAMIRLLHRGANVLLLDEPTRGVDVASRAAIYARLDAEVRGGRAALVVSSYLPELLGACDRIAVMHRGRLGPARPVADCTEASLMLEATGGRAP